MAKPTKDVMIDLETVDVTSTAAVFQVGIVYLYEGKRREVRLDVKLPEPGDSRFSASAQTLKFHNSDPLRAANLRDSQKLGVSIETAATLILGEIALAKEGGNYSISLWACGTDFDIPILANMLRACDLKPNWSYQLVRDFRTVRELFKSRVPVAYKNDHTALADAINQYDHLQKLRAAGCF